MLLTNLDVHRSLSMIRDFGIGRIFGTINVIPIMRSETKDTVTEDEVTEPEIQEAVLSMAHEKARQQIRAGAGNAFILWILISVYFM